VAIHNYQWYEVAIPYWRELTTFARHHGVELAVEACGGQLVHTVSGLHRLIDATDAEVVGANVDPSHLMWMVRRAPIAPVSPRLATYIERWLAETVRPDLAPTTANNYEIFSRLYILPDLGSRRLDRLTVRDVQLWMNQLKTRCQCCHQGKDARRRSPRCCAVGDCCHQIASEWTRHQAWTVLQSALSAGGAGRTDHSQCRRSGPRATSSAQTDARLDGR
jgi:hypothetical protein